MTTLEYILIAAKGLRDLGAPYHDRAATLYELSTNHPDTTPLDIFDAAEGLRDLGTQYHDRAATLYELLTNHLTKTPRDISSAAHALKVLGAQHPENSPERLRYISMADDLWKKHGLTEQR
ncbi:hypothetical protein [Candidatus Bodocaedibacter vickermanii]|uniref:Tetratricopeptide repeat protein n=1 Tax=Candidatus Bodocaedibacter vickermanii TaxID=2741701 RepID=A0A7L9RVR9_9PROT|nr:hypothetical protein CPBP_01259 [Candidatus Paracaedibacteraceae bacterium 'Lake Konstanz']